jgi:hypothetical protein
MPHNNVFYKMKNAKKEKEKRKVNKRIKGNETRIKREEM